MKIGVSTKVAFRHRMNIVAMQSVNLMRMSNDELNEHVTRIAEDNPFLTTSEPHRYCSPQSRAGDVMLDQDIDARYSNQSLYMHLAKQIRLMMFSDADLHIVEAFVLELDECGWIGADIAEVARKCGAATDHVERVLRRLQQCEPAGLFARSLRECLYLQARELGVLSAEMSVVLDHLPLLGMGLTECTLARRLGVQLDELEHVLAHVRSMNPKPGAQFRFEATVDRAPDALVVIENGAVKITLNPVTCPDVSLEYSGRTLRGCEKELVRLKREARELRSAIAQRNTTTLLVLHALVDRQYPFFCDEDGLKQALSMRELAEETDLHVSTVSRVLKGMILETPKGVMLASDLVQRSVGSTGNTSTHATQQAILQLVRTEDHHAPWTDSQLRQKLAQQGIDISRSTIAKYRKQIGIKGCAERKNATQLRA